MLAVMRIDVCRMFANGQDPAIAGDNLMVDLDLSDANLPCGSQLRLGGALLEVTAEPTKTARMIRRHGMPPAYRARGRAASCPRACGPLGCSRILAY